jgi:hypothetical protein
MLVVLTVAGATIGPESVAATTTAKRHEVYFAGQSGWGSEMSSPPPAAPPMGDRYAFGASGGGATATAPPSVVDQTRAAVVESSNALREGVEAGIQAANRQLYQGNEQVMDTARSAGQELTNQFQGWAGTTLQQSGVSAPSPTVTSPTTTTGRSQVSNPFAKAAPAASSTPAPAASSRSGISPPPWIGSDMATTDSPTATMVGGPPAVNRAPAQTDNGWTSVRSSAPPPRLAVPQLTNTQVATTSQTSAAGTAALQPLIGEGGPNFPVTNNATQPADRSLLTSPPPTAPTSQQPPAAATDIWDYGWNAKASSQSTQATIGNRYETAGISAGSDAAFDRDFTKAQQPMVRINSPQPTAQSSASQSPTTLGVSAFDKIGWPENPAVQANGAVVSRDAAAGGPMAGRVSPPPAMGSIGTAGMPQNPVQFGDSPALPASNPDQVPWMPLVVVSLALAGSIGANLFLGWSYVDARQKYRTLVQKTANRFRRAVSA